MSIPQNRTVYSEQGLSSRHPAAIELSVGKGAMMAIHAEIDRVIDVLQNGQTEERMQAARLLVEAGVLRSQGCLPRGTLENAAPAELGKDHLQVIDAAIESADEELKSLLIMGLGEWGGAEEAQKIATKLRVATSPRVIDHCLSALERIGGPASTTAIVRQLLIGNPRTKKLAERHLLELASGGTCDLSDPAEAEGLDGLSKRLISVTNWQSFRGLGLTVAELSPLEAFLSRHDQSDSQAHIHRFVTDLLRSDHMLSERSARYRVIDRQRKLARGLIHRNAIKRHLKKKSKIEMGRIEAISKRG